MQCLKFLLLLVLFLLPDPAPAWKADIVKTWAINLGEELWSLSESLTKSDQIRNKYKQMNASVKKKDGQQILDSSLQSVSTMLMKKINAVKCIHAKAELLAQEFNYTLSNVIIDEIEEVQNSSFCSNDILEYCSAKYSTFTYKDDPKYKQPKSDKWYVPSFAQNNCHYKNLVLEADSHFYNISVNTNHSCVHVPTNIYYLEKAALDSILWTKGLDEVFTQNYKSDPSLSWQYFGSANGILRFYPSMPWSKMDVDTYDCRVRSWYIEAATCSKDVIILFDISGSMTGFKNYVARRTLRSLLGTLSNNDFVNVFAFNKEVREVVPCFHGLVQATRENLNTLMDKLEPTDEGKKHRYKLDGNANLTLAYIKAFETLKQRRQEQHCNVTVRQGCNQLVMVITDYVPGNLTEVFNDHNREVINNVTYIPVRVFTYLIGKEVTNVREIQWMACLNRGFFVHIHSVEEVQQQVLKYINVIARPMILQGAEPPPTWTHANIDDTRTSLWSVSVTDMGKPDEDKLVTSVAIPAFDNKNETDDGSKANLLGVAGTDVPIDSIAKLAQPHQLGVNGYSFIVSNNGYILLHPLLITSINGKLQENYNSVDFVEVEQVDDGKGSRELGDQIKKLRKALADAKNGSMKEVGVLYHYDQMRRIARVQHDYFFDELKSTPFSMGISLPKGYGDTELFLKDNPLEAKQGKDVTGINVTDYFRFSYRIHADWVYCKYHYLEGHEAIYPELELWRFLVLLSKNQIDITKKQYTVFSQAASAEKHFNYEDNCESDDTRGTEDYYCNEDLVKQLVFDAKLTTPYFEKWDGTPEERELAKKYNVGVRFIATSSGLTRWHYIFDDDKNEKVSDHGYRKKAYDGLVFGDVSKTSIEETWYKAAVLQHMIDKDTMVIATRLPILDDMIKKKPSVKNDDGNITITASYAIFYKDGEFETPASVVGFDFSFQSFKERFLHFTESNNQELSCNGTKYDCYVVDSSGYVVFSQDKDQVGQFFGVINKYVLDSLVNESIFEHVEVFNYQALCSPSLIHEPQPDSTVSLMTPFSLVKNLISWLITEAVFLLSNWNSLVYANSVYVSEDDYLDEPNSQASTEAPTTAAPEQDHQKSKSPQETKEKSFSCDHEISLYYLRQKYFLQAGGAQPVVSKEEAKDGDCHPPYWATLIIKTNLLLIVVEREDTYCPDFVGSPTTKPVPTETSTNKSEPCHKLDLGNLPRRRLEDCYTYHEGEEDIHDCGTGNNIRANFLILTSALFATILFNLPL